MLALTNFKTIKFNTGKYGAKRIYLALNPSNCGWYYLGLSETGKTPFITKLRSWSEDHVQFANKEDVRATIEEFDKWQQTTLKEVKE